LVEASAGLPVPWLQQVAAKQEQDSHFCSDLPIHGCGKLQLSNHSEGCVKCTYPCAQDHTITPQWPPNRHSNEGAFAVFKKT